MWPFEWPSSNSNLVYSPVFHDLGFQWSIMSSLDFLLGKTRESLQNSVERQIKTTWPRPRSRSPLARHPALAACFPRMSKSKHGREPNGAPGTTRSDRTLRSGLQASKSKRKHHLYNTIQIRASLGTGLNVNFTVGRA